MTSEPAPGLGAAIRRIRQERGLSQPQLAEKLGVSINAVSQYERGVTVPGVYTLAELADVLDVTYGVLFDEPLATAEHLIADVRQRVRALGYDLALIPREDAEEVVPDLEPPPSAATIASVMAIVDAPYQPGLDVRFEEDA